DALAGEPGREPPAALQRLRPGEAPAFIDRADMVRIHGRAALEEAQRRQRHVIGRILVQADIVLAMLAAHRSSPNLNPTRLSRRRAGSIKLTIRRGLLRCAGSIPPESATALAQAGRIYHC